MSAELLGRAVYGLSHWTRGTTLHFPHPKSLRARSSAAGASTPFPNRDLRVEESAFLLTLTTAPQRVRGGEPLAIAAKRQQ